MRNRENWINESVREQSEKIDHELIFVEDQCYSTHLSIRQKQNSKDPIHIIIGLEEKLTNVQIWPERISY